MRGGLVAVRFHSNDLGFEQRDALGQFVLRIRGQVLASEEGGGIAFGTGEIVVHYGESSRGHALAVNGLRG